MRIIDASPAYMTLLPARKRPAYARVERAADIPGLTRHGRIGDDGETYADRRIPGLRPPHRGRFVDVLV